MDTGNHTIAIIKGQESYGLLKSSCSTIFDEVNKLVECKKIDINGTEIPVEVYVGGDYKVSICIMYRNMILSLNEEALQLNGLMFSLMCMIYLLVNLLCIKIAVGPIHL